MKDTEREQLNIEARKIQSNVRAWILRRQYKQVREAAKKVQAIAKGHLARKQFRELREKASATLVIQKSMRAHIKAKRLVQQQSQLQQQQAQMRNRETNSTPNFTGFGDRRFSSADRQDLVAHSAEDLLLPSTDLLFDDDHN